MSREWLRCQNATINSKHIDHRCLQYAFSLTQHYEEIQNHRERVSNIKPVINLLN